MTRAGFLSTHSATSLRLGLPSVVLFCLSACGPLATAEDPPLVRVYTTGPGPYVGELLDDTATDVTVHDFATDRAVTIKKAEIRRFDNPITLDDAAQAIGLPAVIGRQVSKLSQRKSETGKIARVSQQVVYTTLDESSGLTTGQTIVVYRNNGDIVDPDTGEVLASERSKIAELKVTEVREKFSKARTTGEFEIKLQVGDEVELQRPEIVVAVCPLTYDDGAASKTGTGLAEELTAALVQREVKVVERSTLDMVLGELLAQNTILFNPESAQALGNLTGASVVLTGKITPLRSTGKAHVRLIEVGTGEILEAVSASVKLAANESVSRSSGSSMRRSRANSGSSRSSSRSSRTTPTAPDGKVFQFASSRSLPGYLTATAPMEKTKDDAVRFRGVEKHEQYDGGILITKDRDFLERDFVLEVEVTFLPTDGMVNVGIGPGRKDRSYNGRTDCLFLRLHPPHFGDGEASVQEWKGNNTTFGKIPHDGVHLLRLIKEGDTLTFQVDPDSDGPSDDDMELVFPNVRDMAPYLTSKNSHLFLGGSGSFVSIRLEATH